MPRPKRLNPNHWPDWLIDDVDAWAATQNLSRAAAARALIIAGANALGVPLHIPTPPEVEAARATLRDYKRQIKALKLNGGGR